MSFARLQFASVSRFLFALAVLFLISNVARAWVAEWIYPLDESSLWKKPTYQNVQEQSRRLRIAHRLVPEDPRYIYEKARLYAEAVSKSVDASFLDASTIASAIKDFKEAITGRPLSAEYHAAFALFLQRIGALQSRLGLSFLTADPMRVSEAEVERALFLSPNRRAIRSYAALYFQYRGWRDRALSLWRSILAQDPTQIGDVLAKCFEFYKDDSFLMEIAPQDDVERLVRFQEFLIGFKPKGWGEKVYLRMLPLLIETSGRNTGNLALLRIIGKSYWSAGDYDRAYFWHQKAFESVGTPAERASFLEDMASILLQQGRVHEANALLASHLDFASDQQEIFILYVRSLWYLGEKEKALGLLKGALNGKEPPPEWRNEFASMLYEEGRYEEAMRQWRLLLQETRGSPYESTYRDQILMRIRDCNERLAR